MHKKFLDLEEALDQLKRDFWRQKISRQEFIDQVKKLQLKDDQGRFWMIGIRSGLWYCYNGKEWVQSEPPSIMDGKVICIYCGFENKLDTEACSRCGRGLEKKEDLLQKSARLSQHSSHELLHGEDEREFEEREEEIPGGERNTSFIFRSLSPISFLVFSGTLGLIVGLILGVLTGATDYFSGIAKILPAFIYGAKGNLLGGIIYAGLGAVFGFIAFGFLGFCLALLINFVSSFVGGVKISIDKIE
ncbi:MAG: hypothetical protein WBC02_02390 [Candidatus Aminicenantaceae bacterium]